MSVQRKARGDAKLKTLPEADQLQVMAWLRANTQDRVRELVKEKFGFTTSSASLSEFYSWWHFSRRLQEAKSFADQLKADLAQLPGLNLTDDQLSQAAQRVFEIKAVKEDDPKVFFALRMNSLRHQELLLKEREVSLKEQAFRVRTCELFVKWARDNGVRAIVEGPGNEKDKVEQLGQKIFGEEWA